MLVYIVTFLAFSSLIEPSNSNEISTENPPASLPRCLDPVYPVEFINIYGFKYNTLSMVLFMCLCTIPGPKNNQTIFFRTLKSNFNGDLATAEAFFPYEDLDMGQPCCTINMMINRKTLMGGLEDSVFIFNDDQIKMWANTSGSGIIQWKCDEFEREVYSPMLLEAIGKMLIQKYEAKSTVPFVKKGDSKTGGSISIVNCLIIVGVLGGLGIFWKIMRK